MTYNLEGYVDVASRLAAFYQRFPDGTVQMDPPTFVEVLGKQFVWAQARAFRTPDDPRPGIGTAWEQIPGQTPYTRGSELMVLETSTWGRAIAAVMPVGDKIATSDEIAAAESRRGETTRPERPPRAISGYDPVTEAQVKKLRYEMQRAHMTEVILNDFTTQQLGIEIPAEGLNKLNKAQASHIINALTKQTPTVERSSTPDPDDPWVKK